MQESAHVQGIEGRRLCAQIHHVRTDDLMTGSYDSCENKRVKTQLIDAAGWVGRRRKETRKTKEVAASRIMCWENQ